MFTYKPKKSSEIYDIMIAHRGYHLNYPENSIGAYIEAINNSYAIELDVRLTKDGKLICIHDNYTKRLLGINGKISNMNYSQVYKYKIKKSKENVPLLSEVLHIINGKTVVLIEIKGILTRYFEFKLLQILKGYNGVLYFHTQNLVSYFRLKKIFKDKVFWVLNPFRRRFNFIKDKYYKKILIDSPN